jgi:hypothetical protein
MYFSKHNYERERCCSQVECPYIFLWLTLSLALIIQCLSITNYMELSTTREDTSC